MPSPITGDRAEVWEDIIEARESNSIDDWLTEDLAE